MQQNYNFDCAFGLCQDEKDVNLVDYALLRKEIQILSKMDQDWNAIKAYGERLLKKLRILYYKYDERIVDTLFLQLKQTTKAGAPNDESINLAQECNEHILCSFGSQSLYKKKVDGHRC